MCAFQSRSIRCLWQKKGWKQTSWLWSQKQLMSFHRSETNISIQQEHYTHPYACGRIWDYRLSFSNSECWWGADSSQLSLPCFFLVLLHLLLLRLLSSPLGTRDTGMEGKQQRVFSSLTKHQNDELAKSLKGSWKHWDKIKWDGNTKS